MTRLKSSRSAKNAVKALIEGADATLLTGDCLKLLKAIPDNSIDLTITSPPYCMGKEYEKSTSVEDFLDAHKIILPEIVRVTREGGSICWQTGYHVQQNEVIPLDFLTYAVMAQLEGICLRNRIVWTFDHGLHATSRFSGRHETILWFTKDSSYKFNLDGVRIPQKYPGKRHYKGPRRGEFSGNPLGKNPGDVWAIPNVKGNHIEKSGHPCQFPVALAQRLVRALSEPGGVVLDPFAGSGSTGVPALLEKRRFIGSEIHPEYASIARNRLKDAFGGVAKVRPIDKPIFVPSPGMQVATTPDHFLHKETNNG